MPLEAYILKNSSSDLCGEGRVVCLLDRLSLFWLDCVRAKEDPLANLTAHQGKQARKTNIGNLKTTKLIIINPWLVKVHAEKKETKCKFKGVLELF